MITLAIESMLIFLLLITVGYCYILDKRLRVLRTGQKDLRTVITDLVQTTHTAQEAIVGLRATADDVDQRLTAKLGEARMLADQLENLTRSRQHLAPENSPTVSQFPDGKSIFLRKSA